MLTTDAVNGSQILIVDDGVTNLPDIFLTALALPARWERNTGRPVNAAGRDAEDRPRSSRSGVSGLFQYFGRPLIQALAGRLRCKQGCARKNLGLSTVFPLFEAPGEQSSRKKVMVVQYAGQKAGIVVYLLLGEFKTVIKPLGTLFRNMRGIQKILPIHPFQLRLEVASC